MKRHLPEESLAGRARLWEAARFRLPLWKAWVRR